MEENETMKMTNTLSMHRRSLLRSAAFAAVGLAAMSVGAVAQDKPFAGSKITYWGGMIFSEAANKLLVDTVTAWGEANGVETEVVMINNNETVQKVSAAVASNTLPDALDVNVDLLLLLSRQGVFADVSDVYDRVGAAQGGWYAPVGATSDVIAKEVGRTGVPYGATGNLLLRRTDVLEAAGFTTAPTTWQELAEQSAAVNAPPIFGMGLALSNVGDGNVQIAVMQSFGGRIADDEGRKVTIKSEGTRGYLGWLKDAWDKGAFPPGVATWDGAGDNQAFLSGQAAFIANTGSVGIAAKTQDPEIYEATGYSPLPSGPAMTVNPIILNFRAVPATGKNVEAAKALVEHLSQPEYLDAYYQASIYGPVLNGQKTFKAFDGSDPIKMGLLNLIESGTAPAYPDAYNAAYAEVYTNFIIPKMAQRVVVDGWDFDRAMDEAQEQAEAIYAKY
jgi:multiple sugar transport system substrate-binding protein